MTRPSGGHRDLARRRQLRVRVEDGRLRLRVDPARRGPSRPSSPCCRGPRPC